MAKKQKEIKIYIDPYGNTLNMWWDDPAKAVISEEARTGLDVIVKDKNGRPIGFEKIGFFPHEVDPLQYLKGKGMYLLEAKASLAE